MSYLQRDGLRIYYEAHGSGPTCLLSHGYGATADMWHGQIEALAENHRVVVWDMRGHGRSDSPDEQAAYSEAHTVGDMHALLDEVGAARAVVGGLSLGGYMSLAYRLKHPARVHALMLFDTGPGYKSDQARDAWNQNALRRAEVLEQRGLDARGGSDEVRLGQHRSALGLARAARGMLTQDDDRVIRSLPDIDVPTLIVVGAQDRPFLAATDYMASKIATSRKVVIPKAGHAANLHQPEAFNRAVSDFLASLSWPAFG